jgi:protein-S-isoprenylcysteine O-methyltransferase Ste14
MGGARLSGEVRQAAPASPTPRPRDHAGVLAFPPLLFAGPWAAGWLLGRVLGLRPLAPPAHASATRTVGWALVALGLALGAWAVRTLVAHRTAVDPYRPTTALVTAGPFARSRNPIYVAQALVHLGAALAANALGPLLLFPVAVVLVREGVVRREERYLAGKFAGAYRAYCRRVRRWL